MKLATQNVLIALGSIAAIAVVGCAVSVPATARDQVITPTIVYTVQEVGNTTVTTFRAGSGVSSRMCTLARDTSGGRISIALDCN